MSVYVLDTNIVSHFARGHPAVSGRLTSIPVASLRISAITEGELMFGLEKRPASGRLHRAIEELLRRIDVLPWDRAAAACYGRLRVQLERSGKGLGDFDLLIAAHVLSIGGTLVTADKAFRNIPDLVVEDWTQTA